MLFTLKITIKTITSSLCCFILSYIFWRLDPQDIYLTLCYVYSSLSMRISCYGTCVVHACLWACVWIRTTSLSLMQCSLMTRSVNVLRRRHFHHIFLPQYMSSHSVSGVCCTSEDLAERAVLHYLYLSPWACLAEHHWPIENTVDLGCRSHHWPLIPL